MRLGLLSAVACVAGCSSSTALQAQVEPINLDRFMGPWHVIAAIPIDMPFFSEANAYNGVETYALQPNGDIKTTYEFNDGGFDAEKKTMEATAWVHNHVTRTEWRIQFLWPFRAAYLIAYVDEDYQETIIGVPDRSAAWIMTRNRAIPEAAYQRLVGRLEGLGYDLQGLRRVPHRAASSQGAPKAQYQPGKSL